LTFFVSGYVFLLPGDSSACQSPVSNQYARFTLALGNSAILLAHSLVGKTIFITYTIMYLIANHLRLVYLMLAFLTYLIRTGGLLSTVK